MTEYLTNKIKKNVIREKKINKSPKKLRDYWFKDLDGVEMKDDNKKAKPTWIYQMKGAGRK